MGNETHYPLGYRPLILWETSSGNREFGNRFLSSGNRTTYPLGIKPPILWDSGHHLWNGTWETRHTTLWDSDHWTPSSGNREFGNRFLTVEGYFKRGISRLPSYSITSVLTAILKSPHVRERKKKNYGGATTPKRLSISDNSCPTIKMLYLGNFFFTTSLNCKDRDRYRDNFMKRKYKCIARHRVHR